SGISNKPGSGGKAETDLTAQVSSTTGGKLTIDLTDTGFSLPAGGATLSRAISSNLPQGGKVSFQSFVDYSNTPFGGVDASVGPVKTSGLQTTTGTAVIDLTGFPGGPFSMTNETIIELGANALASTDGSSTVVSTPAPSGLLVSL